MYSLGFRMADLVEEPASLRTRDAPLPRPSNAATFDATGAADDAPANVSEAVGAAAAGEADAAAAAEAEPAAAPQYFADMVLDDNETAAVTFNGGALGQAADPTGWKYWEQPSDGSEFLCPYNTSGVAEVVDWGDGNKQPSARDCARACKCAHFWEFNGKLMRDHACLMHIHGWLGATATLLSIQISLLC